MTATPTNPKSPKPTPPKKTEEKRVTKTDHHRHDRRRSSPRKRMSAEHVGMLVRLTVLGWSGGLLTLYYVGGLTRMDTTFIGGLLTQTLAAFGITLQQGKKQDERDDDDDRDDGGLRKEAPRKAPDLA